MASAWSVSRRLIAHCYLVAFVALYADVDPIVGDAGLWPQVPLARRRSADFGAAARLLYFPSLFEITGPEPRSLKALAMLGAAAAAGAHVRPLPWLFAFMWVVFGSFGAVDGLVLWTQTEENLDNVWRAIN